MINDKGAILFCSPRGKIYPDISPERIEEIEQFFTSDPLSPQVKWKWNSSEIWETD